jgi:hypothetical protein
VERKAAEAGGAISMLAPFADTMTPRGWTCPLFQSAEASAITAHEVAAIEMNCDGPCGKPVSK